MTKEEFPEIHILAGKGEYLKGFECWLIWDTAVPEKDKRSGVLAQDYIDKNGSGYGLVDHLIKLIKDNKDEELVKEYEEFVDTLKEGYTYYAIRQQEDGTIVWDDNA